MKMFICRALLSLLLLFSNLAFAGHYTHLWEYAADLVFGDEALLKRHHEMKLAQAIRDGEGFFNKLNTDEQFLIHSYTIDTFNINYPLQCGISIDSGLGEVIYAKGMYEALKKIPAIDYVTYRGGVYPTGVYGKKIKVGDVIYNNAFTSSSLSVSVAKDFSKIKYEKQKAFDNVIHVFESKSGTNITSFSDTFKWEAEILLHPKTYYEIKEIKKQNGVTFVVSSEIKDVPKKAKVRHIYTGEKLKFCWQ